MLPITIRTMIEEVKLKETITPNSPNKKIPALMNRYFIRKPLYCGSTPTPFNILYVMDLSVFDWIKNIE